MDTKSPIDHPTKQRFVGTPIERLKHYRQRLETLRTKRSTHLSRWREIADHTYPWMTQYLSDDYRESERSIKKMMKSHPARSVKVLAAGMHSGITPPSRKWFRLTFHDAKYTQDKPAKDWLYDVEQRMQTLLQRANAYDALQELYMNLVLYGTAALFIDNDADDAIRFYTVPNGAYMIANSARGNVNTFYREFQLSVAELVERFGEERVSQRVREAHGRGEYDMLIDIVQVIEPNPLPRPNALYASDTAPFRGVFFERNAGASTESEVFLDESGYFEMPVMVTRWEVLGGNEYGVGPGHYALSDVKALKFNALSQAKLIDYLVSPPLTAPIDARHLEGGPKMAPGTISYYNPQQGPPTITALYQPDPNALVMLINQEENIKRDIDRAFYVDIFLSLLDESIKSGITATQILKMYQEKLLMLGPVLERLNNDLLDPMIKRVFGIMMREGLLPDPPEGIDDGDIKIEYVSTAAQGQKSSTITGIETVSAFLGNAAATFPEVLDAFDMDKALRAYAELHDLPPTVIRDEKVVEKIRQDRQQAAAEEQQAMQAQQLVESAKTLSETGTQDKNALTDIMSATGMTPGMGY